jgi:hypothetical protein
MLFDLSRCRPTHRPHLLFKSGDVCVARTVYQVEKPEFFSNSIRSGDIRQYVHHMVSQPVHRILILLEFERMLQVKKDEAP